MRLRYWFIIGIILVTLIYFLILNRVDGIWVAPTVSSFFAAIYIVLLIIFTLRKPVPGKVSIPIIIMSIIFFAGGVKGCLENAKISKFKQKKLIDREVEIYDDICKDIIHGSLLKAFNDYHNQIKPRLSLGNIFIQKVQNDSTFQKAVKDNSKDSLIITVASLKPDEVVIIGQQTYLKGIDANFLNYNRHRGSYQIRAILKESGITYDRQN